jgi:hypothetical protein
MGKEIDIERSAGCGFEANSHRRDVEMWKYRWEQGSLVVVATAAAYC